MLPFVMCVMWINLFLHCTLSLCLQTITWFLQGAKSHVNVFNAFFIAQILHFQCPPHTKKRGIYCCYMLLIFKNKLDKGQFLSFSQQNCTECISNCIYCIIDSDIKALILAQFIYWLLMPCGNPLLWGKKCKIAHFKKCCWRYIMYKYVLYLI